MTLLREYYIMKRKPCPKCGNTFLYNHPTILDECTVCDYEE